MDEWKYIRIQHHNLPLLAMRSRRTVKKHRLRTRNGQIENAYIRLSIYERYVPGMYAAGERSTGGVGGGLGDGVVAVGELELDHVADGGGEYVGDKSVLGAAYYYWEECGEGGC